jgi:K+ transporter
MNSRSQKHVRSTIEQSAFFRYLLQAIGVFAVSMAIADGVLTPAQSVLGAVQGLNEINRDISKSTIIGVTCTILVLLFLAQPFVNNRFSKAFSPVVIVWLALNSAFGMYNLARYESLTTLRGVFADQSKTRSWHALSVQSILRFRIPHSKQAQRMAQPWWHPLIFHRC